MTPPIPPSWRKPVGMLAMLAMLALWIALVVTVADAARLPSAIALPLYGAAGFVWLWLFPTRRMLRWMELGRWRA